MVYCDPSLAVLNAVGPGDVIAGKVWTFTTCLQPSPCFLVPGNLNDDCSIDLEDLQMFAVQWLDAPNAIKTAF